MIRANAHIKYTNKYMQYYDKTHDGNRYMKYNDSNKNMQLDEKCLHQDYMDKRMQYHDDKTNISDMMTTTKSAQHDDGILWEFFPHYSERLLSMAIQLVLYSLSGKTSYRRISRSLKAARFVFRLFQSFWNLPGISAAALSRWLSNFRAIR